MWLQEGTLKSILSLSKAPFEKDGFTKRIFGTSLSNVLPPSLQQPVEFVLAKFEKKNKNTEVSSSCCWFQIQILLKREFCI
jgi:hypothetical protein